MQNALPVAREGVFLATCLGGKEWQLVRYSPTLLRGVRHHLAAIENGKHVTLEPAQQHDLPILRSVDMEQFAGVQGHADLGRGKAAARGAASNTTALTKQLPPFGT